MTPDTFRAALEAAALYGRLAQWAVAAWWACLAAGFALVAAAVCAVIPGKARP